MIYFKSNIFPCYWEMRNYEISLATRKYIPNSIKKPMKHPSYSQKNARVFFVYVRILIRYLDALKSEV